MVTIEDIEAWIEENGDTAGFYDTEVLVNHFVNTSKAELMEKVCEWLEKNARNARDYVWHDEAMCGAGVTDKFINDFKKAMEK